MISYLLLLFYVAKFSHGMISSFRHPFGFYWNKYFQIFTPQPEEGDIQEIIKEEASGEAMCLQAWAQLYLLRPCKKTMIPAIIYWNIVKLSSLLFVRPFMLLSFTYDNNNLIKIPHSQRQVQYCPHFQVFL